SAARVEVHRVTGPLGDPVDARLGWLDPRTAVVELAEASGLRLVTGRLDALRATSRGTGELIATALDGGATRILAGIGGSACTDGGAGLAAALGVRLLDAGGAPLAGGGGELARLARVDARGRHPGLAGRRLEVAVDVASPLLGPAGAAAVFGPQKGADAAGVAVLEAGLRRLVEVVERDTSADPALASRPGAGSAGGCGYGLAALCGAALLPGAALVCDTVGLDAALEGADLVLTGEGRLDASTAAGKAPAEVALRARRAGVPCIALAGAVGPDVPSLFSGVVAIGPGLSAEERLAGTARLLEEAACRLIRAHL
ncbi:MAG TPA: glycerate kinase, partial [Candidatus Dormibacteraeota bacterium]|nr:glycerate kinase [Candidatus Dormibacteraeota bacterium]